VGARTAIDDTRNQPMFSAASLWEIAIKSGLGRADFRVDARLLRRGLLDNGYDELAITSERAVAIANLPPIHKDPFDRMLVAQSAVEGILLLTADPIVAQYPAPYARSDAAAPNTTGWGPQAFAGAGPAARASWSKTRRTCAAPPAFAGAGSRRGDEPSRPRTPQRQHLPDSARKPQEFRRHS
jgi:PIN domain nuclease of toxin-antitoxin system